MLATSLLSPSNNHVDGNVKSIAQTSGHQLMMRPDGRCFVFSKNNGLIGNSITVNSSSASDEQPVSRTYQYRKVMKPMLERKRRARINRCLDELKELMLTALQSEGENVSKLEKADILELTVRHLHKLRRQRALGLTPECAYVDRFRAGFTHCAAEVSQYLASVMQQEQPDYTENLSIDHSSSVKLLQHLGSCIQRIENATFRFDEPLMNPYTTPPSSPSPNNFSPQDGGICTTSNSTSVWRPW